MMVKMHEDRERVAVLTFRSSSIDKRIETLEHICNVSHVKPKVFQEIYDEIAEVRLQMKLQEGTL